MSDLLDSQGLGSLESHLTSCPACTSWVAAATRVTRRMRVGTAESAPDLIRPILEAIAATPTTPLPPYLKPGRQQLIVGLRLGLAVLALGQVALAVPALFFGEFAMQSSIHVARETGAWNLALAVGFVAAAIHPRLAAGLATVLGTFVGVLVAVTLFDLGAGHVHVDRAASHLITLTGLVLVIGLVRAASDRRAPNSDALSGQLDPGHAAA